MLFLWKRTKLGKIWIDGDAVKQIIAKRLPEELYVQEVSFIGENNLLSAYITAPEATPADTKSEVEVHLTEMLEKSGISLHLSWLTIAPQDNKKTTPWWTLPPFWGAAAAAITALFHMGVKGVLWSVFAAVIGYALAWVLITSDGHKWVASIVRHIRGDQK